MPRSEHHHALIKRGRLAPALAVPGVVRVLTHEDVPANWYTILRLIGVEPNDEPVLAEDRVLYDGEPIVAVVADERAGGARGRRAGEGQLRGPAARSSTSRRRSPRARR